VVVIYLQWDYKYSVRTGGKCRNPDGGIDKSGVVPQGVSTYSTTNCRDGDLSTRALQKGGEQRVSNEIDVAAIERKTHPTQGFGWGTK
jgi:hypothetical protein